VIRVNLLGERKSVKKKTPFSFGPTLAVGCGLILVVAGLFIGWSYWSLGKASAKLDADLASAQRETVRLHALIAQVQQFEQRKSELQQRVTLIEQLREDQSGPVHMLDQISRALPPLLWLTGMKQTPAGNDVLIEGRGMTMTALTDFVTNLEASGYFQRSVEIVSTTTETTPAGEMIKFQIKAIYQPLNSKKPAAVAGAPAPAHGA